MRSPLLPPNCGDNKPNPGPSEECTPDARVPGMVLPPPLRARAEDDAAAEPDAVPREWTGEYVVPTLRMKVADDGDS